MVHVALKDVKKSYGERSVLKNIDVDINRGEFIAIVGKSGFGKSTLLRLPAGLEKLDDGMINMNGNSLNGLNRKARIMFQDGRLLPWKRVMDNICLALPKERREKAKEALANVGLEDRMNDWPRKLSGGQKQRV